MRIEKKLAELDRAVVEAKAAAFAATEPLVLPEKCSKAESKRLTQARDMAMTCADRALRQARQAVHAYESDVLSARDRMAAAYATLAQAVGMAGCVTPDERERALDAVRDRNASLTVNFGLPAPRRGRDTQVRVTIRRGFELREEAEPTERLDVEVTTTGSTYAGAEAAAYAAALTAAAQFAAQVDAALGRETWLAGIEDEDVALVQARRAVDE